MPSTFATQREPAGPTGTPAALQTNSGTAAGSVGVPPPLSLGWAWRWSLAASCLASASGCTPLRRAAYCPETMTISATYGRDRHGGGWERESIGVNLTWRLQPPHAAVVKTDPPSSNP